MLHDYLLALDLVLVRSNGIITLSKLRAYHSRLDLSRSWSILISHLILGILLNKLTGTWLCCNVLSLWPGLHSHWLNTCWKSCVNNLRMTLNLLISLRTRSTHYNWLIILNLRSISSLTNHLLWNHCWHLSNLKRLSILIEINWLHGNSILSCRLLWSRSWRPIWINVFYLVWCSRNRLDHSCWLYILQTCPFCTLSSWIILWASCIRPLCLISL